MNSSPRPIFTTALRLSSAAGRLRSGAMGLSICLLLGACRPAAPSELATPEPASGPRVTRSPVFTLAVHAPPPPLPEPLLELLSPPPPSPSPASLPTFNASRRSDLPLSWLPESWYCRWVDVSDPGGARAANAQMLRQAEADAAWERRMMDIFAWDSLLAISWPYDQKNGQWSPRPGGGEVQPSPSMAFGNEYPPYWGTWSRMDELDSSYKASPSSQSWHPTVTTLQDHLDVGSAADSQPVWDQNGEMVYYEIRVNPQWLKNRPQSGKTTTFTHGQCKRGGDQFDCNPTVEIKLAWKVLGRGDVPRRFFTMRGVKLPGPSPRSVDLGLVGMHIVSKVKTRTWIAVTFEHVDNVPDGAPAEDARRRWSFYNPSCSSCCPNTVPPKGAIRRTQLMRTHPIEPDTKDLNQEVQAWLKDRGSIWQHYELVGTQYNHGAASGDVTPKELRNTVIEPYLMAEQDAPACAPPSTEPCGRTASTCLGCHMDAHDFTFVPQIHMSLPAPHQ